MPRFSSLLSLLPRRRVSSPQTISILLRASSIPLAQSGPPSITASHLDEIDALVGDPLISVLRQLRTGYAKRPQHFPHSVILCGVRDVRDYRIHSASEKTVITGESAFNIKAESLRLGDLSQYEVASLYHQHTQETGQHFTPDVLQQVWKLTQGQPWLVNALGYETCFRDKAGRERTRPVTAASTGRPTVAQQPPLPAPPVPRLGSSRDTSHWKRSAVWAAPHARPVRALRSVARQNNFRLLLTA